MAKENIAFLVNLRKNIVEGSKMEGRYYPEGFAMHGAYPAIGLGHHPV